MSLKLICHSEAKPKNLSVRRDPSLSLRMTSILLCTGLVLSFSGCKSQSNVVKIAVALPLTGDIGALGEGIRRAIQMAVDDHNASPASSPKIALAIYDDRSDPKEAVNVANQIASDPSVVGVIGHFNSGCSIPTAPFYARAGLVVLSPAASNPQLTLQQLSSQWRWPRTIFRVNTTDDVQGAVGAEFTRDKLKVKAVSVIQDKTAYGQGVAEEFSKRFQALGGEVLSFNGIQVGDKDFKALLTRVKGEHPGAIYFGGMFSEGGFVVRQARELGIKIPIVTDEANYDPEFLKIAGPAAEGCTVTFLGRPPDLMESAKAFINEYKTRYPGAEIKAYDHYGYEVAEILLEAIQHVGADRARIVDYVRHIHHHGVLGVTSFDEKGDTLNKTITLFTVKNGQFVPVE